MEFLSKLRASIARNDSLLCVGLDPRPDRIPPSFESVLAFNRAIVETTADLVCAYKPNYAFYEASGAEGLRTLRETIEFIPKDIPVILDAKRSDIGSTASAYARATFDVWGADAVTVNPYLGWDGIQPFLDYEDRGVFLLCHTSNPTAPDVQHWRQNGITLYEHIIDLAASRTRDERLGFVVGATYPSVLTEARRASPRSWLLVPGVGAQGGDIEAVVRAGLRPDGAGLIINSSRGILYAPKPREAAKDLRQRINRARETASRGPSEIQDLSGELIDALFEIGSVRFGDFKLRSGKRSPVYIDLRLLSSYPRVLDQSARLLVPLLRSLKYQRIAAIPYGGLPIGTAVSLALDVPLIYPRKEVKEYGTRRAVEGEYQTGDRVLVLDDLITTGGSKIEAIAPLEKLGLEVEDVVVLLDREQGGREHLEQHGYRLHALLGLEEMIDVLSRRGRISTAQRDEVRAFLARNRGL